MGTCLSNDWARVFDSRAGRVQLRLISAQPATRSIRLMSNAKDGNFYKETYYQWLDSTEQERSERN